MARTVRILLFASAREAVGRSELLREVPLEGMALREMLEELGQEYPRLRRVSAVSRFVLNGEYVPGRNGRLAPGDELAIHPPYSGG